MGIRNEFFRLGFLGFLAGQKWQQIEEDEVLGSGGSPFTGSPFAWAGRDRRGEGEEERKKKNKKKENQCWDMRKGEEEEKSWVFYSHFKILYFFLKL